MDWRESPGIRDALLGRTSVHLIQQPRPGGVRGQAFIMNGGENLKPESLALRLGLLLVCPPWPSPVHIQNPHSAIPQASWACTEG